MKMVISMNESNTKEVLVTEVKTSGTNQKTSVKGWIAFNMSSENWAKYIKHNVKIKVTIVKDLGIDERYKKEVKNEK